MTNQKIYFGKIIKETEKAVFVETTIDTKIGRRGMKVWLPKSQIKEGTEKNLTGNEIKFYEIPSWLADAKIKDASEYFGWERDFVHCFC